MNGFLNLLKPPGMSSGAAVAIIKRLTGEKVGHAGTLDPEASGVLPIMVGRATRLLDYFTDKSKSYVAEIAFTGATDTQDAQGTVIEPCHRIPERGEIESILDRFRGEILQCPPAYSALKKDGVPLYALARKGQLVETKGRPTLIRKLELGEKTNQNGYMLFVDCGSGTYIRTLCHDIGQALSCPAHMRFLLRIRHGAFRLDHACTIEEIQAVAAENRLENMLLPLDYPLQEMKKVQVPDRFAKMARNGSKLPGKLAEDIPEGENFALYLADQIVGVAHRSRDEIRFDMGLMGGEG